MSSHNKHPNLGSRYMKRNAPRSLMASKFRSAVLSVLGFREEGQRRRVTVAKARAVVLAVLGLGTVASLAHDCVQTAAHESRTKKE